MVTQYTHIICVKENENEENNISTYLRGVIVLAFGVRADTARGTHRGGDGKRTYS